MIDLKNRIQFQSQWFSRQTAEHRECRPAVLHHHVCIGGSVGACKGGAADLEVAHADPQWPRGDVLAHMQILSLFRCMSPGWPRAGADPLCIICIPLYNIVFAETRLVWLVNQYLDNVMGVRLINTLKSR